MADVIPFPAERPAAAPDRYAVFRAKVAAIFASEAAEQGLRGPPPAQRQEDEILRRLRRIERMLSRLDVPGGAPRPAASASPPRECLQDAT